jgi:hypothetical protein
MKPVQITLLTFAAACMAHAANMTIRESANIIGCVKMELLPGKPLLAGAVFSAASGKAPSLKDTVGTNQLKAAKDYMDADRVLIWNPKNGNYQAYAQRENRQFYPCNTREEWNKSLPVNPAIPLGTGFWIMPAPGTSTAKTIFLAGNVIAGPTLPDDPKADKQLLANVFGGEMTIKKLTESLKPNPGDQVALFRGESYHHYTLQPEGNWKPDGDEKDTPRTIAPGEGFWFIRKSIPATNTQK